MTNRTQLYALIEQARIERERTERIEGIIGGIIFTILGSCVLATMIHWVTR